MYELIQVGENSYYINCPAKMGLYRTADNGVYLIDSGNDKDAGKKVKRILDANGWTLRAIVNTHSNADHTGGNRYLQQQTGCGVFAKGIEAAFIRSPILEPAFLYGGYPCADLRHKFLMAESCEVKEIADEAFPKELTVIDLPGHFFHQVGFRTPDDVVYLADCLCSEETLAKYRVTFLYDIAAHLETLDRVEKMEAACFVSAHAPVLEDAGPLARRNRQAVEEVVQMILALCEEERSFEEILRRIFAGCGLRMNFEQYVLVGSTVRSYLSYLRDQGRIAPVFSDNRLLWRRAAEKL